MSTTSNQSMKKKSLLLLTALIIGGSSVLGFTSQASAKDAKAGPIFNNNQSKQRLESE